MGKASVFTNAHWNRLNGAVSRNFAPVNSISQLILVVALWALFQCGPELQQDVFSLAYAREPNIYAAVFGQGMVKFPTYVEWLFSETAPVYFIVSLLVFSFSTKAQTEGEFALRFVGFSFAIITVTDIVQNILWGIGFDHFHENILGNVIGPTALAFAYLVIVQLGDAAAIRIGTSKFTPKLRALIVLAISLAVSSIIFLIARTFFSPMTESVSLVAEAPIQGSYASAVDKPEKDTQVLGSLFPDGAESPHFIASGDGSRFTWAAKGSITRSANLTLFEGCEGRELSELPAAAPYMHWDDVKQLSASFGAGETQVDLQGTSSSNLQYSPPKTVGYFWISESQNKKIQVAHSVAVEAKSHFVTGADVKMLISGSLIAMEGRKIYPTTRTLKLTVDGQSKSINFRTKPSLKFGSKPTCRAITNPKMGIGSAAAMVLIQFKQANPNTLHYDGAGQSIDVYTSDGAFYLRNIDRDSVDHDYLGRTNYISIDNGASQLIVDNARVSTPPSCTVTISGDVSVRYIAGFLRIDGQAEYVWKDGQRLNKTLWEHLPSEWAIAIVSSFLLTIGVVGRRVIGFMRDRWSFQPQILFS